MCTTYLAHKGINNMHDNVNVQGASQVATPMITEYQLKTTHMHKPLRTEQNRCYYLVISAPAHMIVNM